MDRFCPNCGTRLEEGAGKCPFCGAAAGFGGGKAPNNLKKILAIGGGALAVLVVVVLMMRYVPTAQASPVDEFVRVHMEALTFDLPEQALDFSTDMTLRMGVDNAFINAYFRQMGVDWEIDVSGQKLNTLLDVVWSGAPLMTAQFTYEDGQFGLYIPEASEKYYLFDIEEWYEKEGGSYAQLEALRRSGLSVEEWQTLYQTYLNIFLEMVDDNNLTVERNKGVQLPQLGEKIKADCYTFRPNEKSVEKMLRRLADALEEDQELRNAMRVFWEEYYPTVMLGISYEEDLDEYLDDLAEELREDAKGAAREVVESGFYTQVYIRDGRICYERLAWEEGSGEQAFVYESGKSGMVLYLDEDGDAIVSLEHKKLDKNKGQWSLTAQDDWEEDVSIVVDYEIDPEQKSILNIPYGTYTLSLYAQDYTWENEMEMTLQVGPGENGGSDHTLTLTGQGLMEESGLYDMGVNELFFTLHTTDEPSKITLPSAPAIQVHEEEDLAELAEGLDQLMYLLSGQLSGI